MHKLSLIFCLILSACTSVRFETEELKTNELFGSGYKHYDGKIFSIFCGGNGFTDYDTVKNTCLQKTSLFVKDKGYSYFTMLSKDSDKNQELTSSGTITKYSQYYTILLIEKKMLETVSNYYKVSDYLPKE